MLAPIDSKHMARALALAERGLYTTTPNPRVGCVLAQNDLVVGEGWHRAAGEPHAEIHALADAGAAARGATCYVTLEPCCHTGRTGPCADALIAAGISRLVYAQEDPNPEVYGGGIAKLKAAGIQVDGPLMQGQARALNQGFNHRMATGRPWVRVKMALSLDGRTAMASGDAFWITGPKARSDVHRWRARSCAVLAGWRTIDQDQAQLNVRADEYLADEPNIGSRQPLRVVLDSQLQLPSSARFFQIKSPVLVLNQQRTESPNQQGVEWLKLPAAAQGLDLHAVLDTLGRRQINELLVETGPTLAGQFFRQGLVDELIIYMAPKFMGSLANPLFHLPLNSMAETLRVDIVDLCQIGGDIRMIARLGAE